MAEWWAHTTSTFLYVYQTKEFLISINGENQSSGDDEFIKIPNLVGIKR